MIIGNAISAKVTNNTQGFQDLLSEAMDNTQEPGLNLQSFCLIP